MRSREVVVLVSLLVVATLAACTSQGTPIAGSVASGLEASTVGSSASAASGIQVTAIDPAVTPRLETGGTPSEVTHALDILRGEGVQASEPVQITGDAAAGATLTRRYDTPLSADSTAAFAYFDDEIGGWQVVPSVLSQDRLTLTAQVTHFSFWTDLASDVTFQVGRLFDTRVAAPTCQGEVPSWVDQSSIVFLDDQNAPLLWCVGSDPAHAEILVVKVSVNRGYGMVIAPTVKPTWAWSSFLDQSPFQVAGALFADADATISGAVASLLRGGAMTPGGSEIDFGFSEADVRGGGNYFALVNAESPDLLQLLVSVVMKQLVDQSSSQSVSYAAGLLLATHCGAQLIGTSSDWSNGASALLDCISGAAEAITKGLARHMASSPKYAGMSSADIGREATKFFKFIKIVAAIGVGFQLATWGGDATLVDAARTLSLGVNIAPATTAGGLSSFAGQWDAKFSSITVNTDGTGSVGLQVPCCRSATYPATVTASVDGVTVTVVGPPTIVGDYSPDLAVGSAIDFRWADGFEGQIITGRFPTGQLDAFLCAPGIEDRRCYP